MAWYVSHARPSHEADIHKPDAQFQVLRHTCDVSRGYVGPIQQRKGEDDAKHWKHIDVNLSPVPSSELAMVVEVWIDRVRNSHKLSFLLVCPVVVSAVAILITFHDFLLMGYCLGVL